MYRDSRFTLFMNRLSTIAICSPFSCLPAFFSLFSESIALELRGGGKVRSLWRLALFLQLAACFPSAPEEEGRGDGMKDLKVGKIIEGISIQTEGP